jgi:hypothetical protein
MSGASRVRTAKIAAVVGLALLGLLAYLAAIGFGALFEVLVTVAALVVLVGGGNWLSGRNRGRTRYGAEPVDADPRADGPAGADVPQRPVPDDPAACPMSRWVPRAEATVASGRGPVAADAAPAGQVSDGEVPDGRATAGGS